MADEKPTIGQELAIRRSRVEDAVPIYDSASFEHMQRIALAMAKGSLIPESLRVNGNGDELPPETILANVFLVVNQARRWNMDPFAVAQCTSVVYGRLMYEGKLVAAVLDAKLGIKLRYKWNDAQGDDLGIIVSGIDPDTGELLEIDGTVREWKTTGKGSPWFTMPKRMLAYRGAREWARLHAPAVLLGVYTPDELEEMREELAGRRARPINEDKADLAALLKPTQGNGATAIAPPAPEPVPEPAPAPESRTGPPGRAEPVPGPQIPPQPQTASGAAPRATEQPMEETPSEDTPAEPWTDEEQSILNNLYDALLGAASADDLVAVANDFEPVIFAQSGEFANHAWQMTVKRANKLGYDWPENADVPIRRRGRRPKQEPAPPGTML